MPRLNLARSGITRTIALAVTLGLTALAAQQTGRLNFTEPTAEAATTFTVNSTGDAADSNASDGACNDGNGNCTLRAAVQQANALAGEDTINFSVTGTINLTGALPDLASNMNITGPGAGQLTVRRDTGGDYRILTVNSGASVNISGLTVSNGKTPDGATGGPLDNGGGVMNSGTLTLTGVVVADNRTGRGAARAFSSGGFGGGIYNIGTLSMTDCVVSGNRTGDAGDSPDNMQGSGGGGAGIVNGLGQLTLLRVTIRDNVAGNGAPNSTGDGGDGGGLYFGAGTGTLTDCVISGNRAGTKMGIGSHGLGGGIRSNSPLTIYGSTLSDNTGEGGGAILNSAALSLANSTVSGNHVRASGECIYNTVNGGTLTLSNSTITGNEGVGVRNDQIAPVVRNTIIAGNGLFIGGGLDVQGAFNSQGHNLVGNAGAAPGTHSTGFGVNGDQVGFAATPLDPRLGPLADNGGPAKTHAPLAGSPALDAGDNALALDASNNPLTTDQRDAGFERIVDSADADATATVDIGAFEAQVSVEDISDKTTDEDAALQLTFNVGGASSIASVTAASGNAALVPNDPANIAVTGSGSTRTLTVNPAANKFGTSTITVTVNGGNGQAMTDTFLLTVNPLADTPSVTNSGTLEDTRTGTGLVISRNAADGAEVTSFKFTNVQHGTLFRNNGTTQINAGDFITFAEGNAGLKFTPAQDFNNSAGAAGFDVQASVGSTDAGLGGAVVTANVSVTAVNDAPVFTKGADQSVLINAGSQTVNNWADGIKPGPATATDEAGQFLNFVVTNDNNSLFSSQPSVSSSGTLTYTPAVNKFGQATVSVKLHDSGGTGNGGVDTSAAQTFTVNITCGASDVVTNTNDGGAGSLRNAIATACPNDTITFDPAAFNPSSGPHTITLTSGELLVDRNLTITGPGSNQLTVRRGAAGGMPQFRVFEIKNAVTSISGATIAGGNSGGGGGIFNGFGATLTLMEVKVTGNNDNSFGGGGIRNSGVITLANSTVSGNSGNGIYSNGSLTMTNSMVNANVGSGIFNSDSNPLNVTNSTISGNSASLGGGIFMSGGILKLTNSVVSGNTALGGGGIFTGGGTTGDTLILTNSTISGNTASTGQGGGILTSGALTMTNCTVSGNNATAGGGGIFAGSLAAMTLTNVTVSGNSASHGGGIVNVFGRVALKNTIVAGNSVTGAPSPDLDGEFNSQDYNLIGNVSGATFTGTTTHNIINQSANLGPLADNGGATQTRLPLPGSPAIDAGGNALAVDAGNNPLTTDQRGFTRVVNTRVDIGAVEANYATSAAAGDHQTAPINTTFAAQLKATVTESGNVVSGVAVAFTAPVVGASGTFQGTGTNTATVNTDSSGVATAPAFNANGTAGGPYNVVAGLGAGSPTAGFSLTNAKGSQTITFDAIPNKTYGDPDFNISATASSGLPVSLGVDFGPCTLNGSTVHINNVGGCRITATQFGDSNYNAAVFVSRDLNIAPAPTSTTLSSSANPSSVGQRVTFTATVTSPAGTPPGDIFGHVYFFDGGVDIPNCGASLNSGQATCTTSALSPGSHTITAEYATNNPNFTHSIGTLPGGQVVNGGFQFSQAAYAANEGGGGAVVTVRRDGDTSQAASVDFETDDGGTPSVAVPCSSVTGLALERCDYTRAAGTLNFAAGETQKSFAVLVSSDAYAEGTETASLRLSNAVGEVLGAMSTATLQINENTPPTVTNPIDDPSFFVKQHYADFLNRESDAAGLQFWTDQMTNCGSTDPLVCRVNVSAAFFQSIEFQQTGYLVERMYKVAHGDAAGASTLGGPHQLSVPVVRLREFLRDTQEIGNTPARIIVGATGWEQQLEANKRAFALKFVQRARFTNAYPTSLTAGEFITQLDRNAGGVLSSEEKAQLESVFGGAAADSSDAAKRAQVLRSVAENQTLQQRESNRAFVLMQYFGYLRRDPDAAPDADCTGFDFWLTKLDQFRGNFVEAEMVKAFISSTEYRQRFGQ